MYSVFGHRSHIGVLRADKRKVGPAVSTGYTWNLLTWNFTEADGRRRVHVSTDSYAYATNTDTGHAHQLFFFFDESSTCFLSSITDNSFLGQLTNFVVQLVFYTIG